MCAWMGVACTAMIAQIAVAPKAAPSSISNAAASTRAAVFDVVSIRASASDSMFSFMIRPDGFSATDQTLQTMLVLAYFPQRIFFLPSADKVIEGLPPWATKDRYDINAKVDEATAEEWKNLSAMQRWERVKPMLQAMLVDRCKLVQHADTVEIPIYALVVGKHGAKLKETKPGEAAPSGAVSLFTGDGSMVVPYHRTDPRPALIFFNASMLALADQIANGAPRRVEDQTGLTGRYDFVLPKLEDTSPTDPAPPTIWNIGELGLALKSTKAPMKILVIDHIERPSEN